MVLQGRIENAIYAYQELYERTVESFDHFHEQSMVNYRIAQLYEKKGDHQQAMEYYEKALEQWKHADEDLPEPHDARARLERLKGK